MAKKHCVWRVGGGGAREHRAHRARVLVCEWGTNAVSATAAPLIVMENSSSLREERRRWGEAQWDGERVSVLRASAQAQRGLRVIH